MLRSGSSTHTRSAALLIIGDEILAAKVQDKNTSFLCAQLHAVGWKVSKVGAGLSGDFLDPIVCTLDPTAWGGCI